MQLVQSFATEHLKTPLGEPVKGNKNKSTTELWVEKFYKKVTTLPEPFPHDLVERLEEYLDVSICLIYCISVLSWWKMCMFWYSSPNLWYPFVETWRATCGLVFLIVWPPPGGCIQEQYWHPAKHYVHTTVCLYRDAKFPPCYSFVLFFRNSTGSFLFNLNVLLPFFWQVRWTCSG